MTNPGTQVGQHQLMDDAIAWHVRLHSGEAREQDWVAFTEWLESNPQNASTYRQVEALSDEVVGAKDDIIVHLEAGAVRAQDAVVPIRKKWHVPSPPSWQAAVLGGIAASLLIIVGLWTLSPDEAAPVDYATGIGERLVVALEDGSTMHLNTRTNVVVNMSRRERRITLANGEALFEVTGDAERPFIVAAGSRAVRVVGTTFNVARQDGKITVTVGEGIVTVGPVAAGGRQIGEPVARLTAGQQYYQIDASSAPIISEVNVQAVFAWTDDRLIFDDAPLSEVVEELNRYFAIPIEIPDEAVAALRFSGVPILDAQEAVLKRLEGFLPVVAQESDGKFILRAASPEE